MKQDRIAQIVTEEVDKMFKEAQQNSSKIEKELEKLRKKLFKEEDLTKESLGQAYPRLEKRIQFGLVAEMIDCPVNELMLYFLNCVKTQNTRPLIEMRLGHCYFYAC